MKPRATILPICRSPPANPVVAEFIAVLARMVAEAVVRDLGSEGKRGVE